MGIYYVTGLTDDIAVMMKPYANISDENRHKKSLNLHQMHCFYRQGIIVSEKFYGPTSRANKMKPHANIDDDNRHKITQDLDKMHCRRARKS